MKKPLLVLIFIGFLIASFFSFSAALSYWVKESKTENMISTGHLSAKIVEKYSGNESVYPGDTIEKVVNIENTGNVDSIIRVKVSKAWGKTREDGLLVIDGTLSADNIVIDYNTDLWFYDDGYFYYKDVLKSGGTTTQPLFTNFHVEDSTGNDFSNTHADIKIEMESIQAAYGAVSLWGKTLNDLGISYEPPKTNPGEKPLITFWDEERKFSFESGNGDIFCAWNHLIPGESRSQVISVRNMYGAKVPIYIKAEYNHMAVSPEEQALIDDLLKKYITLSITDESGKTVYNGYIWGNLHSDSDSSMKDYILLGEFDPRDARDFFITINVSPEIDNRYQDLMGKIVWLFKASGGSDSPYAPDTGDGALYLFAALALVCAAMILSRFLRKS